MKIQIKIYQTIAAILAAIFYRSNYSFSYVRLISEKELIPQSMQSQLKIKAALEKARF